MESIQTWLELKSVPGIGNLLYKRLIDRFKSPDIIFQAPPSDLLEVEGMTKRLVLAIKNHKIPDRVKRELDLIDKKKYKIITLADFDYPALLNEIPDPPPYLYVAGNLAGSTKNIAVVGSRNATPYGISTTKQLCMDLTAHGLTIVSGMARGIDTAAHTGALMAKGKTIAVLGSGLEKIYPQENLSLFHQIAEHGAVITEFSLSAEPEAHHFPLRNRIISGISLGTVIVEATRRSGSLITARLAAEQGREVFAVPGSIRSFKSTGTHSLIKQGAKLVENAQDILDELSNIINIDMLTNKTDIPSADDAGPQISSEELMVFKALTVYPAHIDELMRKVDLELGKLLSILLKLELKGHVEQSPGKLFSIKEKDL